MPSLSRIKVQTGNNDSKMNMGRASIIIMSDNQKVISQLFSKCKWLEADNEVPQIIRMEYFLEAQGYKNSDITLYQYRNSVMRIEKNGKLSIISWTKHINVKYFYQGFTSEIFPHIRQIPDFGGWSLDTDPNFGQYWHFCGPFINLRTDKTPY